MCVLSARNTLFPQYLEESLMEFHQTLQKHTYFVAFFSSIYRCMLKFFSKELIFFNGFKKKSTILMDKNMLELQCCEYIAVPL